jgi:hypothetical protein
MVQAVERMVRLKHSGTNYIIMTKTDATVSFGEVKIPHSTGSTAVFEAQPSRIIGLNQLHCRTNKPRGYIIKRCYDTRPCFVYLE